MTRSPFSSFTRRQFLAGSASLAGAGVTSAAWAQEVDEVADEAYDPLRPPPEPEPPVKRNISAFRSKKWQPLCSISVG